VTLDMRATVVWGYMPYGWLGMTPNGLSDRAIVANEPVELIDALCWSVDACELGNRLCVPDRRPSCAVASRAEGVFIVLFREAIRRRSLLSADLVCEREGRCNSSRSGSCRSPVPGWLAFAGRKPSETAGMKSSSAGSSAYSSSKTLGLGVSRGRRRSSSSLLLRRSMACGRP
jgi:hypothetical protein